MNEAGRVVFTKEMKKDFTILVPTMLPIHFGFIAQILRQEGYTIEVLDTTGPQITEKGLHFVHNDACYPAILVIGQLLDALDSGRYDPDRCALMLMQTGGGCRASNYVSLLRKALVNAGHGNVPVISFNLLGIEKNPGFQLSVQVLTRMIYGVLYGDLLMFLSQKCRPYECFPGATQQLVSMWTDRLTRDLRTRSGLRYSHIKKNFARIVADFWALERTREEKVRVGIVGEIFVKFSPLGNNNLEEHLIAEGAEPVMPGLLDFCMYVACNGIYDSQLYGLRRFAGLVNGVAYRFLLSRQRDLIAAIRENSGFAPMTDFDHTRRLVDGYIGIGAKMGEGWLLTAEMLELIESGTNNIVCAQPFGCLPNHIVGKGVMKHIREVHPEANLVAIDYDPSSTEINQENRIKLMLANAQRSRRQTGPKII